MTRTRPAQGGLRATILFLVFWGLVLASPLVADRYGLAILTTVLWFAYVGQAWNLLMGFAGQLSLGHALYVGLGAYVAAGLYVKLGVVPWVGMLAAVIVAAGVGLMIGALAFRFGLRGVHFALATIAFAEFTRIAFDHVEAFGGSGGLFLPVAPPGSFDLVNLRLDPTGFFYVMAAATLALFLICRSLRSSRLGTFWLAVREDQEAAAAAGVNVFRAKLAALAISAAATAPAGVFLAFLHSNLFPDQLFSMGRSIEIIIAPIVGGIGTLFGPILGAFLLIPLAEGLNLGLEAFGLAAPGLKLFLYGLALVVIIVALPQGVWPGLSRLLLGKPEQPPEDGR